MKRTFLGITLLLCVLLSACGLRSSGLSVTQSYEALDPSDQDPNAVATILYDTVVQNASVTHILNDNPYASSVLIAPRFVGSKIMVSMINAVGTEDWEIVERTRMEVDVKENTLLRLYLSDFAAPNRMWYIEVTLPDGTCYTSPIPFSCEREGTNYLHIGEKWDGKERLPYNWGEETIVSTDKPVIYLYPQEECSVDVELDYRGQLTCTYPKYEDGWSVTAGPDGTLTDQKGQTYNYLYWEGVGYRDFDFSRGFCVPGEETAPFLEEALDRLGLTRQEANEFMVYWLPLMEGNSYNVISFQKETYEEAAKLRVTPQPDTVIRVFMAWYGSDRPVELPAQELTAPTREGFTLVEWGGSEATAP